MDIMLLHEYAPGLYKRLRRKPKDKSVKINKKQVIDLVDSNSNDIKPVIYTEKTFIGSLFGLPLYRHLPCYLTSYSSNVALKWSERSYITMDAEKHGKYLGDLSLKSLLEIDTPMFEQWLMYCIFLVLGMFVTYFIMSGGLNALSG